MADEFERLLEEVERRLCRLPGQGAAGGHRHGQGEEQEQQEQQEQGTAAAKGGRSTELLTRAESSEEDLDDIIDEICNDSSLTKTPLKLKSNSASLAPESSSAVVQARGKRTCDQLRCTACDFRVSLFNDYIWDPSCDYLFFRNNMPELRKLRAKMITRKGARAYACFGSNNTISVCEMVKLKT